MLLNGLDKAIQELLSNAEQRMCARHVLANWSIIWKGIERRNYFGDVPNLHMNKN